MLHTRRNGVTLLRLLLALLVVVSHGFGLVDDEPHAFGMTLGTAAVIGFFGLSGYLVAQSYLRSRSAWRYLAHRALRILPGYYLALVFVAAVVGPLLAWTRGLSLGRYLGASDGPVSYLIDNAVLHAPVGYDQVTIAGLPSGTVQLGINSPLWTLGHEIACYVMLLILLALLPQGIARWASLAVCAALALMGSIDVIANWAYTVPIFVTLGLDDQRVCLFALAFFVSVSLCLWRVPLIGEGVVVLVTAMASFASSSWASPASMGLTLALVAPYVLLTLAFGSRLAISTDLSYGTYVLAWPVQQLFASLGLGLAGTLGLAIGCTLPLAWISWHVVEHPALALKRRLDAVPVRRSTWAAAAPRRIRPLKEQAQILD